METLSPSPPISKWFCFLSRSWEEEQGGALSSAEVLSGSPWEAPPCWVALGFLHPSAGFVWNPSESNEMEIGNSNVLLVLEFSCSSTGLCHKILKFKSRWTNDLREFFFFPSYSFPKQFLSFPMVLCINCIPALECSNGNMENFAHSVEKHLKNRIVTLWPPLAPCVEFRVEILLGNILLL